ncbi:hypothetical protein ASPWEDRAFT_171380 [Aspergillus wentii DTO 134E9]|uniref:Gfo/Idh/MocA-like oxidoreductase N-terminal domain-containing protein n=1 Tax=Aspergillus wentii DTO 134E9 TaxID=1073089 RepID=A0A1L9RSM9_ASPWE|nr:uncharacterized protein ASPWEDRAFT_171380 [Aspergillus wentii DTO 134E9]OJJ37930.1 hypothetical protein ASPWEDRAFT_171380 [Aspergillus wentii DTO 134E9]
MTISIALIGAGIFIQDAYLPAIQANPNVNLKAVYSRSSKAAASITPELPIDRYADDAEQGLQQLLERSDIQAVIIALPIPHQAKFVRAALTAGKHVLSEKPIAKDVAEASELVNWYKTEIEPKGTFWSVAENWRYTEPVQQARKQIARLGKIRQFRTQVFVDAKPGFEHWKYFATAWRKEPTHQGGIILDFGVHWLAATRYLIAPERVNRVSAFVAAFQDVLPPADSVDAILSCESGAQGIFQFSTCSSLTESGYTIVGENGNIIVNGQTVKVRINGEEEVEEVKPEYATQWSCVVNEVKAWGEGLERGEINKEQSPGEALADLELVELILKSSETGTLQVTKHQ